MRRDGGFGFSDPTRHPQFIHPSYVHYVFMRIPPNERHNRLGTSHWWSDEIEHFLYTNAASLLHRALFDVGHLGRRMHRLTSEDLERFRVAGERITERLIHAETVMGKAPTMQSFRSIIHRGLRRLRENTHTDVDFVFQIGLMQRAILEARAFYEFWTHYALHSADIATRRPPLNDFLMGGFTTDPIMVDFCINYGIPVFGVLPSSMIPSDVLFAHQGLDDPPRVAQGAFEGSHYPRRFFGPAWGLGHGSAVSSLAQNSPQSMIGNLFGTYLVCISELNSCRWSTSAREHGR